MSNYRDFDLADVQASASGMDSFFDEAPMAIPEPLKKAASGITEKSASTRKKVASVDQLSGFTRTASGTLVSKSDNDLWSLQKEADGEYYIERMFEDGDPVKG